MAWPTRVLGETMTWSRRSFLGGLAMLGCGVPTESAAGSLDFPLGVSAGDAHHDSALLWTRYVGEGELRLEWWPENAPEVRRAVAAPVSEERIAKVTLSELEAGTWWHYVFVASRDGVDISTSDEGRFRTALAADSLEPLTLGASSCSHQRFPLTPLSRVAQQIRCDAFLLLGDTVYADGAHSLDEYRGVWREALARRPNRLLRQSAGLVGTWDDHEIVNDATPDTVSAEQMSAARQAAFEYQPLRPSGGTQTRLWRTIRWGRTAELFVLDCRSERNRATGEYVSAAQMEWLKAGLASSQATFKLILNSVPISSYPGALFQLFAKDRWEGFAAQRESLLRYIDEAPIDGVVWLSGDFHMGVVGRVSESGPGANQLEIAAGPAGQSANPSLSYPGPPQFDFATSANNVAVLDLNPAARTVRVRFLDGGSKTLFDGSYTV